MVSNSMLKLLVCQSVCPIAPCWYTVLIFVLMLTLLFSLSHSWPVSLLPIKYNPDSKAGKGGGGPRLTVVGADWPTLCKHWLAPGMPERAPGPDRLSTDKHSLPVWVSLSCSLPFLKLRSRNSDVAALCPPSPGRGNSSSGAHGTFVLQLLCKTILLPFCLLICGPFSFPLLHLYYMLL